MGENTYENEVLRMAERARAGSPFALQMIQVLAEAVGCTVSEPGFVHIPGRTSALGGRDGYRSLARYLILARSSSRRQLLGRMATALMSESERWAAAKVEDAERFPVKAPALLPPFGESAVDTLNRIRAILPPAGAVEVAVRIAERTTYDVLAYLDNEISGWSDPATLLEFRELLAVAATVHDVGDRWKARTDAR